MTLKAGIPLTAPFGQKKVQLSQRLTVLEQIVQDGRREWIKVGEALCEIRDSELYKERGYTSFSEYCEIRWGFKKSQAYRLMEGSAAAMKLPEVERPKTEHAMRKVLKSQQKVSPTGDTLSRIMPPTPVDTEPEEEDLLDEIITRIRRAKSNQHFLKALKEWLDESGM
jgi:hypothetical protein